MNREEIHIIARNSNWSESGIQKMLREQVYSDEKKWISFLNPALLVLSSGMILTGIICFFAYNWDILGEFFKFGLVGGLIVLLTIMGIYKPLPEIVKKISLLSASILVGVLFAIFGQVYQTGADAYDLFLIWSICILVWVVFSGFWAQWLLLLILLNITLILYSEQVAFDWDEIYLLSILFTFNSIVLIGMLRYNFSLRRNFFPQSMFFMITLALVFMATLGVAITIFEENMKEDFAFLIIVAFVYILGILYGISNKKIFYPAIIFLSLILIVAQLIIRWNFDIIGFLIVSIFLVISFGILLKQLITINKIWTYGQDKP